MYDLFISSECNYYKAKCKVSHNAISSLVLDNETYNLTSNKRGSGAHFGACQNTFAKGRQSYFCLFIYFLLFIVGDDLV
jgi:hypothetical protein